ncbi:hypothetical protein MSC49_18140 [Methylosinus sp. C49]|uniref:hypothetical protein n=1 Tax=Methylosinus sp. C49 TaxID=2699395 RepID=UPI00136777DD|nr:hypothetical protein [Methylosinus sp. C49]BBU61879.1 hypothetical protein MSC49_18140 [Methylosinus sp. C49]
MHHDIDNEQKISVHWDGPIEINWKDEIDLSAFNIDGYVIYLICGTHGMYGKNVPLYIGKTEKNTVMNRIGQHLINWLKYEPDSVYIYAAAVQKFASWEDLPETYSRPDENLISAVEEILIYAHQPAYNKIHKSILSEKSRNIRVFNSGKRTALYPEISGFMFYQSGLQSRPLLNDDSEL